MKKPNILEFYKSKSGFRWKLKSSNGKTIGASTEGFKRIRSVIKNYLLHRTSSLKVEGLEAKTYKKISNEFK